MLFITMPKSAGRALTCTIARAHGRQCHAARTHYIERRTSDNLVEKRHGSTSDVRHADVKIFAGPDIFQEHIWPTRENVRLLCKQKKVVVLRPPEQVIEAWWRAERAGIHDKLFPECRTLKEYVEKASPALAKLGEFSQWSADKNTYVVHYDEIINETESVIRRIEKFFGLQKSGTRTLLREHYTGETLLMENVKVTLIGLGKLGLPLAVCLAQGGVQVTGVDLRDDVLETPEPGLREAAEKCIANGSLILGTSGPSDAYIILVNTPEKNGTFSTEQIESALETVPKGEFIILSSTVSPGTCDHLGVDAYVPDFVALGTVLRDFMHPSIFLVGARSPEAGQKAAAIISHAHRSRCLPSHMSLKDAEYAKVFLNNYIALKISYANLIAQYTEDPVAVCKALGQDPRIGAKYFKPGPPWGGQCFPRDVRVLSNMPGNAGDLGEVIDAINETQYAWLLDLVKSRAKGRILICGLAFKPGTDCCDNSPGTWLLHKLQSEGYDVRGWDPCTSDCELEGIDTIVNLHSFDCPTYNGLVINPWEQ